MADDNTDLDYEKIPQEEPKDEVLVSGQAAADLAKLYHGRKWTDVTLAVGDRRFNAHRLILSTRCPYFKNLFESEPDKLLYELDSAINPDAFEIVLEYIYCANIVATRKMAESIAEIAVKLNIKPLMDSLASFAGTKLTEENVLQEIQRHFGKNKSALEHCLRFLDHHIMKIGIENPQLLTMPVEIMNEIVRRQTLGIDETELFRLLQNWRNEQELNNDKDTVKRQATQLAQHLKLHLLQPETFFNGLKQTGWISTEILWDVLTEMINSNRRYGPRSDEEDPKFKVRKPGPKTLKSKRKVDPGSLPDFPIALLGKDASGKTTTLYKLKLGEVVTTIPTVGFNVEEVQYKSARFTITDCGYKVKASWMDVVSPRTAAMIWVVDSNTVDCLLESIELKETFDRFGKPDMPVLIIANKQDLPYARSVAEIAGQMGMSHLGIKNWFIQATCAASGDGLYEGLDWLHKHLNPDYSLE
jgi:ADP-ribosylation factor protein 1